MKAYVINAFLPKMAYFINLIMLAIPSRQIRRSASTFDVNRDYRPPSESQNIEKERLLAFYNSFQMRV